MRIISEEELQKYGTTWSLSRKAVALVNQQKATWPLAGANYRSLKQVETKWFDFGTFRMACQYNPGRIRSSAADTSAGAISARPCFLCEDNRPPEQLEIPFREDFVLLANPFPIFPYHLTIPSLRHIPQRLEENIPSFLELSRKLQEFTLLYNGPRCGASAPDHLHFQAGFRNILPIEEELEQLLTHHADNVNDKGPVKIFAVEKTLRRFIALQSRDAEPLAACIQAVTNGLEKDKQEEPMMNILSWIEKGGWNVLIFPRSLQRPYQYYANEPEKLVISPAAVELGGLVILPRKEDFEKITARDLESIFSQVTLGEEDFRVLKEKLAAFDYLGGQSK